MRVLLIYSNSLSELLAAPPIGLSYIATATRRAGHDVMFLDLLINDKASLQQAIAEFEPDVIGMSVRNIDNLVHQRVKSHIDVLAQQIREIKEHSDVPLVLGGPAISILGTRVLDHLDADYCVVGEGEISFPLLLKCLENKKDVSHIPGLCYRNKIGLQSNPPQVQKQFADSGMAQWINWPKYQQRGATWSIQSKRGCPLSCSYCTYSSVEGCGIRKRNPVDVVDEIEYVANTIKPRCFEFVDSTFNLPPSHTVEICEEIIRRGLKIRLTAMGVNPLGITKELLELMKRAGFNSMMITPESASDIVLERMKKGFAADEVYRSAELAKKSGIPSMWYFMLGAPGETRATVEETMRFVESMLPHKGFLSMFTTGIRVLPGTELARDSIEEGYFSADEDFWEPTFYFSKSVSEAWMLRRVCQSITHQPNIVHAAEDSHPVSRMITDRVYKAACALGAAPPYWRFLPGILRIPPLPRLRGQATSRRRTG
ncbi:MAG: radical SAM protein [Proteobacteria bacterium]|nr:radical SAM protein [Pseudomonadota bacterium]